ncbi:MAG: T9SS type A sorting domain-containing protein [Reichenbachiella sp.]
MKKLFTVSVLGLLLLGLYYTHPDISKSKKKVFFYSSDSKKNKSDVIKFDAPNEFAKAHILMRTKFNEQEPGYKNNDVFEAFNLSRNSKSNARSTGIDLDWKERGPANVPGRTRGLVIDPSDNSGRSWFAGSVGGGVWKTENAGENWTLLTPDIPAMAISCLVMAESNPKVLYAGTGESFSHISVIVGNGIFKSSDGGVSWDQLGFTADNDHFRAVNRMIVHPEDENIVLACTETGTGVFNLTESFVYKSTDGGVTWSQVMNSENPIQQLVQDPIDYNIMYASVNADGIYKSSDAGESWEKSSADVVPQGRIELSISPVNNQMIFASVEGALSETNTDLYVSDNAGEEWSLLEGIDNIDYLGGQGGYDNAVMAHPFDENIFYVAGVNVFQVELTNELSISSPFVREVSELGTDEFMSFSNFGGPYHGGALDVGNSTRKSSIEIRFGEGVSQKAHRFTVDGLGSGVENSGYFYKDYVSIPFEAWDVDVEPNVQLMVSFRDQQEDGEWNLLNVNTSGATSDQSREYFYIHNVNYNELPDENIAVDGSNNKGIDYEQMYFMWPYLLDGATILDGKYPDSKLLIDFGTIEKRSITVNTVTDAYAEFGGENTSQHIHPDHHNLISFITNVEGEEFRILSANDGGVYYANQGTDPGKEFGDWNFAGSGYNTTQFYGADKKRGASEYFGGAQDNGTWISSIGADADKTSLYRFVIGGDGFEVVWNYSDPNKLIGGSQNNGFARSLDGGVTWESATNGLNRTTENSSSNFPFISKIANSKSKPNDLYTISVDGVYKSTDWGGNWKLTPLKDDFTLNTLTNIEVSLANPDVIWAGTGMTETNKLHVSKDGGESFVSTNNFEGDLLGSLSGIGTHPSNDGVAYALYSFAKTSKVLKTSDFGESWEDITGFIDGISTKGFPDVAVYSIFVFPNEEEKIWVGTEIGLVESLDGGDSWNLADNGFPAVSVWQIKQVDKEVVIATHGRGIWSVELEELNELLVYPEISAASVLTDQRLYVEGIVISNYDSTVLSVDDVRWGLVTVENEFFVAYIEGLDQYGEVNLSIVSYLDGKAYNGGSVEVNYYDIGEIVDSYATNFNDENVSEDFVTDGFVIGSSIDEFSDGALHSPHPYVDQVSHYAQLKRAIRVAKENPIVSFQNIALIEKGEEGTVFGDPEYYDYVVVEGSKDGIVWTALSDGYDASKNALWSVIYDRGGTVDKNLFAKESIDLSDTYSSGDVIFIRFKLYADPLTNGYGWVIDDLVIQGESVLIGIEEINDIISVFPNPVINKLYFKRSNEPYEEIVVSNVFGQIVGRYNGQKTEIDVSSYDPGMYLVNMTMKGVVVSTTKIIKE